MNSLVDEKIKLSNGKTLKLANIMIQEVNLKESADFSAVVLQMENYIKSKGAMSFAGGWDIGSAIMN